MVEESKREHTHVQTTRAIFHHETYAPRKGENKTRFSVEPSVYVAGLGYDVVDPMNSGNEFMIGFYNYVKMMEVVYGYEHIGKSSDEIKNTLNNLWGEGWDD